MLGFILVVDLCCVYVFGCCDFIVMLCCGGMFFVLLCYVRKMLCWLF